MPQQTTITRESLLAESVKLLASHEPFQRFMDAVEQMRETEIRDACQMDVMENPHKVSFKLGTIAALTGLKDIVAENVARRLPLDS